MVAWFSSLFLVSGMMRDASSSSLDRVSRDVSMSFNDSTTPGLVAIFEITVLVIFSQFVLSAHCPSTHFSGLCMVGCFKSSLRSRDVPGRYPCWSRSFSTSFFVPCVIPSCNP